MPTRVRSYSKINLGLAVGPARPDGFHGLTTCYQTLALYEHVTVSAQRAPATEIAIEADRYGVPSTLAGNAERNTAYKIVYGALSRLAVTAEVHIRIEKRLPVQGGLGAGSANAAAALLGLERELGTALPGPERLHLAAEVGSDVPLFLLGGTVVGLNRGESVFPLPDGVALPVVVAVPSVGVSTAQAFRDLDAQMNAREIEGKAGELTASASGDRLSELSRVLASAWTSTGASRDPTGIVHSLNGDLGDLAENPLLALVRTGVENDFESVAFRQHPSLRDIKHALVGSSVGGASVALYVALSGSGSALFGIYGSSEAARAAQQRVQFRGIKALLTETLARREYWEKMFA